MTQFIMTLETHTSTYTRFFNKNTRAAATLCGMGFIIAVRKKRR
jgi:hypothetical protein